MVPDGDFIQQEAASGQDAGQRGSAGRRLGALYRQNGLQQVSNSGVRRQVEALFLNPCRSARGSEVTYVQKIQPPMALMLRSGWTKSGASSPTWSIP